MFPRQFYNAGVAEQNMMGIAAGMALEGYHVFVYSIGNFPTFRCAEQIRNDVCHNNLNVKLIGVGGGFSYGNQGISHNPTEDLAVMRTLPNLTILCPGSKTEAELVIKTMFELSGPVYLRLSLAPKKSIYKTIPEYKIGKGLIVKDGKDLTIFCCGNITQVAVEIAKELGLDIEQYKQDYKSAKVKALVAEEKQQFANLGKQGMARLGVPKFLINGKEPQGRRTVEGWSAIIEAELKKIK